MKIRKGDFVARKSYGKDILFIVDRVIKLKNGSAYAILKGVTIRIEADAPVEDIEKVERNRIVNSEKKIQEQLLKRLNNRKQYRNYTMKTGRILHLDGDSCLDNKNSHWLINVEFKEKIPNYKLNCFYMVCGRNIYANRFIIKYRIYNCK